MKLSRAIAILVIAASLGLAANVRAQSHKDVGTPNEFPPASYKGKQYVDSKGCVYIRAGVDGNVTWVPRMTRDRKVICGYKPTIPNAAPSTASAQKLDKNVVVIEPAAPPSGTSAKPKAKPAAKTKPKPKPATTTAATPAAPKPKSKPKAASTEKTATAKPAKKPATSTTTASTSTAASTSKTTTTNKTRRSLDSTPRQSGFEAPCRGGVQGNSDVRCGPQSELPYTPGTGNPTSEPPKIIYKREGASLDTSPKLAPGAVVREGEVASNVRVIPRHLYQNYQYAQNKTLVPKGYARVFDDGRLNPQRAVMTFAGKAASDTVWTEEVPRHVRDDAPVVPVVSTKSAAAIPHPLSVISTKSAAPEKSLRLSASTYVQVATYTDATAAQSSARKVRGLGLPAKIGKYEKNGQTHRMVLVGPFADADQAERAVTKVHRAGYPNAFVR